MDRMLDNAIIVPVSALRRVFIGLVVLILLISVILVVRSQLFRGGVAGFGAPNVSDQIDRNAYQGVFLVNGTTYFGKVQLANDDYYLLYDVYYLSVPDQTVGQPQLIKRGTEIQAPREPMIIPAREVLFIENLREDGDVATAIKRFKSGELPAVTRPPVTAPPATASPAATPAGTARPSASPTR